jgi:signal peptidase II
VDWSPKARVFWPILLTLLVADCASKELAETYLGLHTPREVAGSFIRLSLAHNSGAAMGLSFGASSRIALSALAVLALVVLGRLYASTRTTARLRAAALGLIVGGAVGNLLSRLLSERGVTDFIDIGLGAWRFWTFNLADTGITVGAALLLVVLRREKPLADGAA